jgi:hypothetical protein
MYLTLIFYISRYSTQSHNSLIRFICPAHVKFQDPLLMMTRLSEKKKGGGDVDDADKNDILQTFDKCVELDVDLRLTVNEIKERLLECCSSCLVDLGLQNKSSGTYSQSTTNRNMVVRTVRVQLIEIWSYVQSEYN